MQWPYMIVALVSGMALACQVGFNTGLRVRTSNPIIAALISFLIGTACIAVLMVIRRPQWPTREHILNGPRWMWLGGVVGAIYVGTSAAFASKLTAAGWLSLVVTGQILASLILDHYGLLGFAKIPLTAPRVLGAMLLLAGVYLVVRAKG